jgi:hypothetical protein
MVVWNDRTQPGEKRLAVLVNIFCWFPTFNQLYETAVRRGNSTPNADIVDNSSVCGFKFKNKSHPVPVPTLRLFCCSGSGLFFKHVFLKPNFTFFSVSRSS